MKLEKITIEKIIVKSDFNVREDFGDKETIDLQESLKRTDGNIQPLIVCQNQDEQTYELISGERRLRALKEINIKEASCIVYTDLTEIEKTKLMLHENLGRKNLTWKEEVKALKKLKELGEAITVKLVASNNSIHEKKAWRLIKALEAVEEFPELENEKTRKDVLTKYKKLKGLSEDKQESVKNEELKLENVLEEEKIVRKIDSNKMVIDELKEDIVYYKSNPYTVAKNLNQEERFKQGVLIKEDVQDFIKAARICETFGMFCETDKTCIQCKKEAEKENLSCKLYNLYFEKKNEL
jgi:ParB family transcriptional regulator, chromosome partitioning protein